MNVLETHIRHLSDAIHWIDRTGTAAATPTGLYEPPVAAPLAVLFDQPLPSDLRISEKPGRTLLWRRYAETGPAANVEDATMQRVIDGMASRAQMARPAETAYAVAGQVTDPSGRFNPRRFAISAGNLVGHALILYRTPLGTRFGGAGGINCELRWQDGAPGCWAVATLVVTPPVGAAQGFTAQADANGDLLLPLGRLPALTRDAPQGSYDATLTITADPALTADDIPDPAGLPAAHLVSPSDGSVAATASFTLAPGTLAAIVSQGFDHLQLRSPP